MRSRWFRAAVAATWCAAVVTSGARDAVRAANDGLAVVAKPAPNFLLDTPDGGTLTLRDFAGKPLVLNVFASWCPPCRLELPLIVSAARRTRAHVAFLGVDAQEAVGMATGFARRMRLPYPIAIDHGQFAATYGAVSIPVTVFVDKRGIVRAIKHGALDERTLAADLALIARP